MPTSLIIAAAEAAGFFSYFYSTYAVVALATNFALSYVVNRVFGSKPPSQQNNGVRQQIPPSADNTIPVVYGNAWLGGTFIDAVLSTDAKTMYYVLVISNIANPDGSVITSTEFTYDTTKFYYGDRLITFDGTDQTKVVSLTDGAGNVDTKISGKLFINLYTSNASGTITSANGAAAPSTVMGGADITSSLRWPSSGRQMNGLAFAIVKVIYDVQAGSTGLQPVTFKVAQTFNGTGVAKPGHVLFDYFTSAIYGGAVPAANVNTIACAALNTYSDQTITYTPSGGGSATQARYRINGVINTGETVLNNVDKILTACDSWISYETASGQWTPIINKEGTTAFAFDDSNIIGEIRVSATDISQSVNQIEVSFPNKDNKDQPNYVYLKTPSGLLYPNEPVNKYSGSFDMVNDSVQAQYLANRILEQAREDLIVSFNTAYPGIQVNVGDVVSVTNDAYGWSAKLFRVMRVTEVGLPEGGLGAQFEMNEYNAQVYADTSITAFTPAPNSNLSSAYYFPSLNAPTFSDSLPSASPPTFSVSCALPSTVRVTTVTLYFTTVASPTVTDWVVWTAQTASNGGAFPASATIKFTNVVIGSGTYYFAFTVGNEVSTSQLSSTSSFNWTTSVPTGPTGPTGASVTGPTGATGAGGPTGSTGTNGLSSRICYAKSNLTSLNSTPTTYTTTGSTSFPPYNTWGGAETWQATPPTITAGQALFQSTGTYDPTTNLTTWTVPYLSNLKVGQLSAITADMGTITAGSITASANINVNGVGIFAGNSTTGLSYGAAVYGNGTTLSIYGVYGQSNQLVAAGVRGDNSSATSFNYGVWGNGGIGVYGHGTNSGGYGGYFDSTTANKSLFTADRMDMGSTSAYIYGSGSNAILNGICGAAGSAGFAPTADNAYVLGGPSLRWSVVYAATGTINTSDGREKTDITPESLGLNFINQLNPVSYRWKVGQQIAKEDNKYDEEGKLIGTERYVEGTRPGQRIHHGLIAQEVKQTLDNLGIQDFAGWVLEDKDNPESTQGLRYTEFIAPLIKAVQELSQKVADLEAKLK